MLRRHGTGRHRTVHRRHALRWAVHACKHRHRHCMLLLLLLRRMRLRQMLLCVAAVVVFAWRSGGAVDRGEVRAQIHILTIQAHIFFSQPAVINRASLAALHHAVGQLIQPVNLRLQLEQRLLVSLPAPRRRKPIAQLPLVQHHRMLLRRHLPRQRRRRAAQIPKILGVHALLQLLQLRLHPLYLCVRLIPILFACRLLSSNSSSSSCCCTHTPTCCAWCRVWSP
mmetsp:Transcript_16212/g.35137  ORF Transcript_16212/g.35137 Transcript_16212/m.35137 type:complete len:225 (+) Transcript_16212:731-1405(+)